MLLLGYRQTFRCIRTIMPGEEVVHSYIDIAATTSDRQEKLMVWPLCRLGVEASKPSARPYCRCFTDLSVHARCAARVTIHFSWLEPTVWASLPDSSSVYRAEGCRSCSHPGTPVQEGDSELELAATLHAKATGLKCDGDEEERDALLQAVAIRAKVCTPKCTGFDISMVTSTANFYHSSCIL